MKQILKYHNHLKFICSKLYKVMQLALVYLLIQTNSTYNKLVYSKSLSSLYFNRYGLHAVGIHASNAKRPIHSMCS